MCGVAAMELQSTVAHEDIYYISMDNEVGTHAHEMLSLQYMAGHPLPLQMEFVYRWSLGTWENVFHFLLSLE